jgi:hypothetical protein
MGRLYDRRDLEWNLNYWNRLESRLNADIANGLMPASTLNAIITYRGSSTPQPGWPRGKPDRHVALKDSFELERKRERMKLLRTGQLLRDLDYWRKAFLACKDCYSTKTAEGKNKDVACDEHNEGLSGAKSAVYWAGEHNEEERAARGQIRPKEVSTVLTTEDEAFLKSLGISPSAEGENPLNKWESWYQRDKAAQSWPRDASQYDVTPDYKGWLNMLLQNEEMTEREYLAELQRLKDDQRELEGMASPTDRNNPRSLPKNAGRGRVGYQKDRADDQKSIRPF